MHFETKSQAQGQRGLVDNTGIQCTLNTRFKKTAIRFKKTAISANTLKIKQRINPQTKLKTVLTASRLKLPITSENLLN